MDGEKLKKLPVVGSFYKDLTEFPAQVRALLNKGLILQLRQYKTNIIQLLFPIIIIGLILLLQVLFDVIVPTVEPRKLTPPTFVLAPILSVLINNNASDSPPYRYLYTIDSTVDNATLGYLDRDGKKTGFMSSLQLGVNYVFYTNSSKTNFTPMALPHFSYMNTTEEIDALLYAKLNRYGSNDFQSELGTYHFKALNWTLPNASLNYDIQYDQVATTSSAVSDFCDNVKFFGSCRAFMPNSMMSSMNGIFLSKITSGRYAVQSFTKHWPYTFEVADFRVADRLGSFFYPLILMFLLPVFMYTIVLEKQGKLREMMKLMGMKVFNYFLVTYATFFFFYIIVLCEFLIICLIAQFRFITGTHPLILFLGFIGWGFSLVSWSFFLSAFIGKTLIAVVTGYLLTIFGATAGTILETFIFEPGVLYYKIFLFIHPLPLSQFINAISTACNALRCPQIQDLVLNNDILFPIIAMYVNAVLYLVLGLYFDAVLPQPWGIRKSIFFPITWMFNACTKGLYLKSYSTDLDLQNEDEDVTLERNKVMGDKPEKTPQNSPVLIKGLRKVYNARKTALHELSIALDDNECFGLLGPNGAGKSTTISMLCGLFGPSQGTAFVNQFDIRTDIDSVHLALGLCPQFDIQWDDLTVQEHLEFYARLKGMPLLEERKDVKKILDSVGLWEKRSRKTGNLSGGMRRRLSIAIAFVGDPKIVMLDEPTTGLDPTSKRHLWDSILKSKQGRCIILTTHSMEEADVLCDRIGIVCRGRLKCVASSQRLKNKFGEGFNLGINFKDGYREQAVEYISSVIPEAKIHVEFKSNIIYEIEKEYVKVSKIFKQVEAEKENVGIVDWALSQTTLEDVFLNIVRKDEIEFEKEIAREQQMLNGGLGRDAMFDTKKTEEESKKSSLEMQDVVLNAAPEDNSPEPGTPVNLSNLLIDEDKKEEVSLDEKPKEENSSEEPKEEQPNVKEPSDDKPNVEEQPTVEESSDDKPNESVVTPPEEITPQEEKGQNVAEIEE
eukprot:gene1324-11407_t